MSAEIQGGSTIKALRSGATLLALLLPFLVRPVMRLSVLLSLCLLVLSACGFHLRGLQRELPFRTVAVSGSGELARQLRQEVEQLAGTRLVAAAAEADGEVRIQSETLHPRRIIALTRGGKVAEYQLRYTVDFAVYDGSGRPLLQPPPIELRREFPYDDQQALAKGEEERRLVDNMRQQAIENVLRQVSTLHRSVGASQ